MKLTELKAIADGKTNQILMERLDAMNTYRNHAANHFPALVEAVAAMLPLHESYQSDMESPSFKGSKVFVEQNRAKIETFRAALAAAQEVDCE